MTIRCDLEVSGTSIENSFKTFSDSVTRIANGNYIRKYQNTLNNSFQQHIRDNMNRSGMENVEDLEKTFFVNIEGNNIIFGTNEPLMANRYEYGWEDDDDYNEDNYLISTSPRYYIRPAINQMAQELGAILANDIYRDYAQESSNAGYSHYIISQKSSYLDKYSGIL